MTDDRDKPLYLISVVSEMLSVHPQTLRTYEREGFVLPTRVGGQRLYSEANVEMLRLVLNLTREMGVNRAGVDIVLRMRRRMVGLQEEVQSMMQHLEADMREDYQEKIRRVIFSEEDDDNET